MKQTEGRDKHIKFSMVVITGHIFATVINRLLFALKYFSA